MSGDTGVVSEIGDSCFAAIVDVLGHGTEANALAVEIESYLGDHAQSDVEALMLLLHEHLRGTRGAAVGLCSIDESKGVLAYVGIGNTALRRFGSVESRLVSRDGICGQNLRTPKLQTLALEPGDLVLLYTDGVKDRFRPGDYHGLRRDDAQAVAHNVIRLFGKDHDDAGCVALRYPR